MAESTMALSYTDYVAEISRFLGYGSAPTGDRLDHVLRILKMGYHQFLYPPVLPGERTAHEWSFLAPVATLGLVADSYQYDLPDNFGSLRGVGMTYPADNSYPMKVNRVSEGDLRIYRAKYIKTADPKWFGIRPKSNDGTVGQRYEVIFAPTPDKDITLTYRYNVLVDLITEAAPYPLGGAMNSQVIMDSCLAMAEASADDSFKVMTELFARNILAAIQRDRQGMSPDGLGYNGDWSDGSGQLTRPDYEVSYDGTVYEGF